MRPLNPFTLVNTDNMTVEEKQNYKRNNYFVGVANQSNFCLLAS